jgi:hypothetical protein
LRTARERRGQLMIVNGYFGRVVYDDGREMFGVTRH